MTYAPRHEDAEPGGERDQERRATRPHPPHLRRPRKQGERDEHAGGGDLEAAARAQDQRQRPVAAAAVLLELIQLGQRIEPCEQRAKREQHER